MNEISDSELMGGRASFWGNLETFRREMSVLVNRVGRVATVTLNRPRARNAISRALLHELRESVLSLDASNDVGAIVLTGAGDAFCAGLDLKELATLSAADAAQAVLPGGPGSRGPFATAEKPLRTPIIAAINGPAVTGGLELALACDVLIASELATFADTHARVGVMPSWGMSVLLPERIGRSRARQMSLSGNYIDARTAYDFGLVSSVVPHDQLLGAAEELARAIADAPTDSVRELHGVYRAHAEAADAAAWERERAAAAAWAASHLSAEKLAARLDGLFKRGRSAQPRPKL